MLRLLLAIIFLPALLSAQDRPWPSTELSRVFFLAEVTGLTSTEVNPAGLSLRPDDDGALVGYDFVNLDNQGNSHAALSMGNLGFTYHDYYGTGDLRLRTYSIGISVGGNSVSLGTSNRLVKTSDSEHLAVDAALLFSPVEVLRLAAVVRNLNEPDVSGHDYSLRYAAGLGIFLLSNTVNIFGEVEWQKGVTTLDDSYYHVGVAVSPVGLLELRTGVYNDVNKKNNAFFMATLVIKNSLHLSGALHMNERRHVERYSTMLRIPLQTVRF